MPTSLPHVAGDGSRVCGDCLRVRQTISAALRTYRHQELRERIRRQRVLDRELPGRRERYPDSYSAPDFSELGAFEWEVGNGE